MRIMVGLVHPKQVHIWKNIISDLQNKGHEVKIVAWDKDLTLYLLNAYGFKYEIGKNYRGLIKKAYGIFESEVKLLKIVNTFKPHIFLGGVPYMAHVSKLVGKPHISFIDTEHAKLANWLTFHFTDVICTSSCYKGKINPEKHIKYNGYIELAYLHPNYFKPDSSVLDVLGLNKDDRFIIIRFVSWQASHDIGQHGFTNEKEMVEKLKDYGRVFITSERKLSENFEKYRLNIPPEKMHDLLYYATLYIGEGAAMASESAILGTPSIYVNTQTLGYLEELEQNYGLVHNFSHPANAQKNALSKAVELLEDKDIKNKWRVKREKLLNDKIDVTKFITEFIEDYPK